MEYEEPSKPIEFNLTSDQLKTLNDMMPTGYILQFTKATRREGNSKSKKIFLDQEGTSKKVDDLDVESDSKKSLSKRPSQNNRPSQLTSIGINSQPSTTQHSPTSAKNRSSVRTKKPKDPKNLLEQPIQKVKGLSEDMKKCNKILQQLKKNINAGPFLYPVDPVELKCHDYFDVIKEPIDLQTVETQLKAGLYISPQQYAADIKKIWYNSFSYNIKGSQIHTMTLEMQKAFDKLYKDAFEPQQAQNIASSNSSVYLLQKQVEKLSQELNLLNKNSRSTKGKSTKKSKITSQMSKNDQPMTMNEKRILGQNIRALPPDYLKGVWEIVSDGNMGGQNREVLEFDIDTLPVRKTRELDKYVKDKIAQLEKAKKKKKGGRKSTMQAGDELNYDIGQQNNYQQNAGQFYNNDQQNQLDQNNQYNQQQNVQQQVQQDVQQQLAQTSEEQSDSMSDESDGDN